MNTGERNEVLLIAGRSGVGKSTVAWEVSAVLRAAGAAHCLVEGDLMDQVHPAPPDDPDRSAITERNLAAIWANYAALGQRRLIYTNTVSVLEGAMFRRVLGADVRIVPALLTADDATARARLTGREIGSQAQAHIRRSAHMARHLDRHAPPETVRVATDGRTVVDIAREVVAATGW
ncbi:AAA family ATPase [Streptomyces buecherae]|uniref:AAA family ATPase n=1 Tax=Streptomyces buecherae TaxID=2763006 RepID=UPI00364B6892